MELDLNTVVPYKIFDCVAGSRAYGLDTPESDTDLRGVFLVPESIPKSNALFADAYDLPQKLVKDEKGDRQYYRLDHFLSLAASVNPSMIELFFMPEDCIRIMTPAMQLLIDHRDVFISARARSSFSGYAMDQIKKAKGQNKWVNNPQPEKMPSKLDFTWVIPFFTRSLATCWDCNYPVEEDEMNELGFPARPIPARDFNLYDLGECEVAKLEHAPNMYRLYDGGRGVFRGPNEQLVVESISKQDEYKRFRGLMIFNEQEWKKAVKNWKQYWEWRKNRNDDRWVTQESGEMDYDAKNMMHCLRILWSGIHILDHGVPKIRFDGEKHDMLMGIRLGKYTYEEIMKHVEEADSTLGEMSPNVNEEVNYAKIEKLYQMIIEGEI